MKVKVLSKFRDKNSGKIYKAGETIEVSEARYKEITAAGPYVEAETPEKAADNAAPVNKAAAKTTRKR